MPKVQGSKVQPSRRQKAAGLFEKETPKKRISNFIRHFLTYRINSWRK